MGNSIPKIIHKLLDSAHIEFESGRMIFFYPDYLVAKVWADVKRKAGVDAGIISDSKKKHTRFNIVYRDSKTFSRFARKIEKNKDYLSGLKKALEKNRDKIVRRLETVDFEKLRKIELANFAKDYYRACENLYMVSCILRCVDRGLSLLLEEELKDKKDKEKIIQAISIPEKPSHSFRENIKILKLAKYLKDNSLSHDSDFAKDKINKLEYSFGWITAGNFKEKPRTVLVYRNEIEKFLKIDISKELQRIENERSYIFEKRKNVLKKLNRNIKKLSEIASQSAELKDEFKFFINEVLSKSKPFFKEVSKRFGIKPDILKDFSFAEMNELILKKKFPEKDINRRSREYVLVGYDSKVLEFTEKSSDNIRKKYLIEKISGKNELKGRIASSGYGKGKAKIILGYQDFHKLKKGDILIVNNTTPDFVPIMKKAAAIAAEEGGLTAHVSIVSREFGIPCVVGVKNITKIIKDGDLVEVDAERGVVRVIIK